MMKYKSCIFLENNYASFRGNLDQGKNIITFCCGDSARKIAVELSENPAKTMENFYERRNEIINESLNIAQTGTTSDNIYYNACLNCKAFEERDDWQQGNEKKIHQVTFAVNPSPCQAKCIYCSSRLEARRGFDKELDAKGHELVLAHFTYLRENNLLADCAVWELSAGEITVHPYREQLYQNVGNDQAMWLSNCFIYSEEIANNLRNNEKSYVMFSMDAGTAKTWKKIKGVDNFTQVKEVVTRYTQAAINPSRQVLLKYIVLPGKNDDIKNLSQFAEFAKSLQLPFSIAKDRWAKKSKEFTRAAVILITLAAQNKIPFTFNFVSPEEIKEVENVFMKMKQNMVGKK